MKKPRNPFIRNLQLWALLPLFAVGAVLMTPQDARAVASVENITITSDPGTDGAYEGGDTIEVYVQFTAAAFRDATKPMPYIKVKTGTRTRTAYYDRGSSRTQWYFNFTVGSGSASNDMDGIEVIQNTLAPASAIRDTHSFGFKAASLGHDTYTFPNHKVDTLDPTLNSIAITSSAGNNNTYRRGEKIQVTATMSEEVVVTGTPQLTLNLGGTNKTASYTSGSDTKSLVFEYTVATGDVDTDGISVAANQLSLNGGTIKDYVDRTATLTHTAITTQSSHKVDASPPTVSSVKITSTASNHNNTYKKGDTIQARVTFSRNVTVTGTPQLTLKIGAANKTANYASGSGTRRLVFGYTVASGDADTNGIEIAANQLSLNSGTIKDGNGNAATLTHPAVAANYLHKVDGVVPTISSVSLTSTAGTDNTYKKDDKIQVTVGFSKTVSVTGSPQLTLTIGTSNKTANFTTVNSTGIVFEYTVAAGDEDTNGISIAANQLSLNGSVIKDSVGNPATLTHTAVATQSSHKVDGVAPTVSTIAFSSSAGTDNTYKAGDTIQVQVTFSKTVNVTGTPQVTLAIGDNDRAASYTSGNDTTELVFAYTVASGDNDTDGTSIAADQLSLNGGTITDNVGNPATLTHTPLGAQTSHKVDTTAPTVSTILITSTAPSNNHYKADDVIQVTVTFSEVVNIGNIIQDTTWTPPQLTLTIGGVDKNANYFMGNGSATFIFLYTVASGDTDTDGISLAANQLSLNGNTLEDITGNPATLTHSAYESHPSHKVDTTAPTIAENGISITSTTATSINDTYKIGDTIQATVTFSENVWVTGTPQLTLKVGTADRTADYIRGTGTANLVFAYTVASGDTDTDGISIAADQLSLNDNTLEDIAGNPATLTHLPLDTQVYHKVDGGIPTLAANGIAITSAPTHHNTYKIDEIIQVTLTFSEPMTVTGPPQLTFKIGTDDKTATYKSGSSTASLIFEYTVAAGDVDTDGIEIQADQLEPNGGTITDIVGNPATLTHPALPTQPDHKVEARAPTISMAGIEPITSTARRYSTYQEDETIEVTLAFSETVYVTGTPQFTLKIGTADRTANYTGGTGTTKLVFAYKVNTGDEDADGIGFEANQLTLPDTTVSITDLFGNTAILTHPPLPFHPLHKVDAVLPHVKPNGIAITSSAGSDDIYTEGEKVEVTLTFNETVTVINTPQVTLNIGGSDKSAEYMTGTGTAKLVFEYTIDTGNEDTDGIEIQADQLSMNNGTIRDIVGNTATLTHPALPPQPDHKVDAVRPRLNTDGLAVTSTSGNNYYRQGAALQVTATFNETVTVTGTPTLGITIGMSNRSATYRSGSGTTKLVFEYTIATGDMDTDGISILANQITVPVNARLQDTAGNPADVTHRALDTQPTHKVDGVVPTVAPKGLAITSIPTSNNTYTIGETIQVTVTFTENVAVTNTPQVTLKIGAADKTADYKRGTGTKHLVFEYTVATGDTDTDGIEIAANTLSANNGTIKDIGGNPATLTHAALTPRPTHKVDSTQTLTLNPQPLAPTVSSLALSSTGPYRVGDNIEVTVSTSAAISVTGTPTVTLVVGAAQKTASYHRGSESTTLVFRYTVVAGDTDTDGIAVKANTLTLNGGTLENSSGRALVLDHDGITNAGTSHAVDTTAPTVNGLSVTSTSTNNYYKHGATLQVTATLSETVKVTGTPTLTLTIGTADKTASYTTGSDTTALVFEYTVASGDTDTDGISIRANQLSGTIKDTVGNTATLTHTTLGTQASHKIDGIVPMVVTNGVAMSSTPNSGDTYKKDEKIHVQVTFSEKVTVSGTPQLTLKVGSVGKIADYTSGTGTASLVFGYTVVAGDTDTDGISISANQLSGTITDAAGNAATLTHAALDAQASHKVEGTTVLGTATAQSEARAATAQSEQQTRKGVPMVSPGQTSPPVDTTAPTVSSVTMSSSPSTGVTYKVGDTLQATVSFSESVNVTGTPQLTLTIGSASRIANYQRGNDTAALIFDYTVAAGDTDTNGISVSTLSGTITDAAGNAAILTGASLSDQPSHKVDTTAPSITAIAITSTPGSQNTYQTGEKIQVQVTFSENVEVTDTPQLTLKIGTGYQPAAYTTGSGTAALVFSYTVQSTDSDTDGIEIAANQLTGGTIADAAGNAADLTNTLLPTQSAHKVGAAPNTPGDSDPNGDSVKANSLTGGTIQDTSDNTLDPNPPALPDQSLQHREDTTAPQVSSLAFTSTGPYTLGDVIQITVTTTENVTVTKSPRIPIVMDETTKYARYASGSETTALLFEYTVAAGDTDTDGIEIPKNALEHYNGSTIKSHYHTDLTLSHASIPADPKHIVNTAQPAMPTDPKPSVDTAQPVITADPNQSVNTVQPARTADTKQDVESPQPARTADTKQSVESPQPVITGIAFATDAPTVYTAGTTVEILVTFAETGVKVTPDERGTLPSLSLLFGPNADPDSKKQVVTAPYKEARPGSTKLVFAYPVTAETPMDADGVQIKQGSLKIPAGAAITDASENPIAATPSEDGSSLVAIKPASQLSSRPIVPAVTSTGILFNEFLNAKTDKHDWVELRNTTDSEVSLGGWKLNISSGNAAQTDLVELPDMTVPAGAVLLLVNTAHKETHLEHSEAATYRYLKVPELRLHDSNFSLMLRDKSGAIVDVVSSSSVNTEDAEAPTGFKRDEAYLREQPTAPGYEFTAWQPSGYQGGLGYNRKAPKETSLGTPGYLQSPLVPKGQTAPVSISEIMFTTGTSGHLPQWIELYNASKTEVATLQDWHLHVEVADPMRQPMYRSMTFRIQRPLRILPKQTVLVVTKNGRNSQHFPEHRLYTLTEQHPETAAHLQPDADLLGDYGYAIVLRDAAGTQIDIVGNLDGNGNTRDAPMWKLPNCMTTNGHRSSIIRQYEEGAPLTGTHKSSWFRATEIRRQMITYYGHPKDIGNPGWKKGGPLPVQLSSFRAERTEQGALIQWTTESELENAGFNVLRSETKTGTFTVVTPRMLQGAGTTSERSTYQYVDTTAKANVAYYYRLEEVSFSGVQQPVATRRLRGHVSAANRYLTTLGNLKKASW